MKSRTTTHRLSAGRLLRVMHFALGLSCAMLSSQLAADETCLSPYMAKIVGQEDFIYIWTLGVPGLGDEQDKLVTVDVNPASKAYGTVIASLSVGGRNEAHHSDLTDDRSMLWAAGLDTNKIFIFDLKSDPAKPTLKKTIGDFVEKSGGVVGPHTTYALPVVGAAATQGFEATFLYYMASTFEFPADGFAFNFGNLASTNAGEEGLTDGLAVGFNLFNFNAHRVLVDGVLVAGGQNAADPLVDGQWHAVKIRWEKTATTSGALTLIVDGVVLFDALPTPGFNANATDRFVFTARTGAYAADILIDDVLVRPLFTSPFPLDPLTFRRSFNADPNLGVFPTAGAPCPATIIVSNSAPIS